MNQSIANAGMTAALLQRMRLLFSILITLFALNSIAQDFEFTYKGHTISYTVIDPLEKTVQTKDEPSSVSSYYETLAGDLEIPKTVSDSNGINYSVTAIGESSFAFCFELSSVVLPETVTTLGANCFDHCTNLTSIALPEGITCIPSESFQGCEKLSSIKIPESATYIGSGAFFGAGLTSIILPSSIEFIGGAAFYANNLTSIIIPESVTEIYHEAFSLCRSLESVHIPASITYFDWGIFYGCSNLSSVYYAAKEPIGGYDSMFSTYTYENAILYVPAEAVEKCAELKPWSLFKNIKPHIFSGVEKAFADSDTQIVERVNLMGCSVDEDYRGIVIVRFSDGSAKKVMQ